MVDDDKLMQWVQKKLDQGVSEERIRKSLRNTGHDPSIVEKAKDPFSGQENDDIEGQEPREQGNQARHAQEDESTRNLNKGGTSEAQDQGPERDSQRDIDRSETSADQDRKSKRWNDTRKDPSQNNENLGNSQNKDFSQKNQRDQREGSRNTRQNPGPQNNNARTNNGFDQSNLGEGQESGSRFSMPQISTLEVPKPNLSALPLKTMAVVSVIILLAIGGFAAYQSGMMSGISLPVGQGDDVSADQQSPSETQTAATNGCPDVGVRVIRASSDGNSVTARLAVFNNQIEGTAELYDGGNRVESKTFFISDRKTVEFNNDGDEVVFRPAGCNKIKDSFSLG